jgi:putative metallohydrolase (TIGR04338 family)
MTRDTQRSRVYGAEIHGEQIGGGSVPEVQAWVDQITGTSWWRARCRLGRVGVRDGRGRSNACAYYDHIRLPRWARTDGVVLHEVAHVLISQTLGGQVAPHGREFTGAYLALVRRFIGAERYQAQRDRFRERRVKVGAAPKAIRSGARPRGECGQCGKPVVLATAWRLRAVFPTGPSLGRISPPFCTRAHLATWVQAHTVRG